MMGLGKESLDSLDSLATYELSDHDKAASYFQRADTLQMMGQSVQASEYFKQSLSLRPCKTERYYQYVNACKDTGVLNKQDWSDILDEIQQKLKACEGTKGLASLGDDAKETLDIDPNGDIMESDTADEDEDEEDDEEDDFVGEVWDEEESVLHSVATLHTKRAAHITTHSKSKQQSLPTKAAKATKAVKTKTKSKVKAQAAVHLESHLIFDDDREKSEDGFSSPNSAVYWALYIAAEKAGRNALAWWYLEYANNLEKSLRAVKFDPHDATTQTKQIVGAFTPELLESLSYMKGKGSKVPIFIVGFMR